VKGILPLSCGSSLNRRTSVELCWDSSSWQPCWLLFEFQVVIETCGFAWALFLLFPSSTRQHCADKLSTSWTRFSSHLFYLSLSASWNGCHDISGNSPDRKLNRCLVVLLSGSSWSVRKAFSSPRNETSAYCGYSTASCGKFSNCEMLVSFQHMFFYNPRPKQGFFW